MSDWHEAEVPHRGHSFVIRIWWEKGHADPAWWRGWVQHAATGKSCYFEHVTDLLTFIEAQTGPIVNAVDEIRKQ